MINQAVIITLVAIFVLILIIWLIKRNAPKLKSLFGSGDYIDVIPKKQEQKNKSILIADIESIIKSSESLDKIVGSSQEGGKLYEKILLDKELVTQIRNSKDNKEIEKILSDWLEKKRSGTNQPGSAKESETTKQKVPAKKQASPLSIKEVKEQPTPQTHAAQPTTQEVAPQTIKGTVQGNWTGKSKEIYDEIKNLLESKNLDKLVDIIKTLSNNQIEEILKHYFENFETNKFGAILQKSSSPRDVTNLLKSETIKGLEWEYERIKENISIARRKGINTKHEELLLLSVPHKIKMFQATFDKKDFNKVRDLLIEIENSLKDKEKSEKK